MLQNLYSIPVYKTKLPDHELVQKDFEEVLKDDKHFSTVPTWYSNVETTFGNPQGNELPFQRFIKSAVLGLNGYLEHFDLDQPIKYGIECWVNRYKETAHQEIHNHAGKSIISCAYMMNTPPNSGNFVFYRNTYDFFHLSTLPTLTSNAFKYNNRITPPLKEGDIVYFPSTLEHYVTGNNTNETRATISANFILEVRDDEEERN